MTIAGGGVHAKSEQPHHGQGRPVGPILCFSVGYPDIVHLLLGVSDNGSVFERVIGSLGVETIRNGLRTYTGWCHAGGVILTFPVF